MGGPPPMGAPPGGAWGQPPGGYGPNPYGPNPYGAPMAQGYPQQIQGSTGLGFCAGFFGGCIGLGLVLALAKGPDTKKGAWIGFVIALVIGIPVRLMLMRHL